MLPFFPSLPNQNQSQAGNNPPLQQQQAMQFNPNQQNPPGFNHPAAQAPPLPHGQNPRFPAPPRPNFNNPSTPFNQPCFQNAPNAQFDPQAAAAQNTNLVMAALQFLQQQLQFPGQQNYLGQPQNNNLAALMQTGALLGAVHNAPPNVNPATALQMGQLYPQNPTMIGNQVLPFQCPPPPQQQQMGLCPQNPTTNGNQALPFQHPQQQQQQMGQLCLQNSMANGNQVLPFQSPQQQQQQQQQHRQHQHHQQQLPASSMHTFNIPPSAQPGSTGNSQILPANSNLNIGKGMVPNGAMQWKNRDPSQFVASKDNGQSATQEKLTAAQKSQPLVSHLPVGAHQARMNLQLNGQWQPQVNHVGGAGNVVSNKYTGKNFTGNFHGHGGGGSSNTRGQIQFPYVKNAKGNTTPFTKNDGRGRQKQREKNQLKNSTEQTQLEQPRCVPFKYTEDEVAQWREARKRNFPTKAITMKKSVRGGKFAGRGRRNREEDEDAKLRRQQLKEILAKQAELGVEVAEIPPRYLVEHGPKRRWDHPKKPKTWNKASIRQAIDVKRSPTLLQKLLSSEVMRDKSRLLQVFRFMALNSFFEQWPDKPLEFPVVTVEDTRNDVGGAEGEEVEDHVNGEENERVESQKPEEGEISE